MESSGAHKTLATALSGAPRAARFWRVTLALLIGAVSYLALVPQTQPQQDLFGWDKLNHLSAFAALAAVGALGFARARMRVALGLLAFGAFIEVAQSLTPNRMASWGDLLADVLGIALGFAVARGLIRTASRFVPPQ